MNLRQTAEVSAIVATYATHVIENPQLIPTESLHGYWKQSRSRLKCWFAGLRAGGGSPERGVTRQCQQPRLISISREILVTEMLTRVWSTVLTTADRHQQATHATATARSTFQGHLEARTEVLRLIAHDDALPADQQLFLDRFRRRIERWTDALLGPLLTEYGVDEYAFDEARARDFSSHSLRQRLNDAANACLPLLIAGVGAAIPGGSDDDRERMLLNRAIVRSILSAFPMGALPGGSPVRLESAHQLPATDGNPGSSTIPCGRTQHDHRHHSDDGLSFTEIRRSQSCDDASD